MSQNVNTKQLSTKWLLGVGFIADGDWLRSPTVDGVFISRQFSQWFLESVVASVRVPITHPPGNRSGLRKLCGHFGIKLKPVPVPVE